MKSPQSFGKPRSLSTGHLGKIAPYLQERADLRLRQRSGHVIDGIKRMPTRHTRLVHATKDKLQALKPHRELDELHEAPKVTKKTRWPFVIRRVQGHSMVPVLPPKTMVWGLQWFNSLRPGDVVIFKFDDKEMIKRVSHYQGDRLFVVGDHVETSTDSRHFGAIPSEAVIAKVVWPHRRHSLEHGL